MIENSSDEQANTQRRADRVRSLAGMSTGVGHVERYLIPLPSTFAGLQREERDQISRINPRQ
jgi:hypothetical protein